MISRQVRQKDKKKDVKKAAGRELRAASFRRVKTNAHARIISRSSKLEARSSPLEARRSFKVH
jgi:hypothetical protein